MNWIFAGILNSLLIIVLHIKVMTEPRRRGFYRQLLATEAARNHPETFEIYVQSAVSTVRGIRNESRTKLPLIVPERPHGTAMCEKRSTVEPHPPIRKKVDADNVPPSIARAFPHLKHRNMIYRHGEPPLPQYTLEWPVTSKVDTFRRDGSPERQSRTSTTQPMKTRPPKVVPPTGADAQLAELRAHARNAALLRTQVRHLIIEVVDMELHKRKSITRDYDASLLKLLRRYEDLKSFHKGVVVQSRHESRRLSRQLARSLCVDALNGALNVKAIEDRETSVRRVVTCQELEARSELWILYWQKIGFATPEQTCRESLMVEERTSKFVLNTDFFVLAEHALRSIIEKDQRNMFDDVVLLRDIIASSCSIDEREAVLRSYVHNDEEMERMLLHFHGAFRWISLEEVQERLALRKQLNEHLRLIHLRESSAVKIQSLQRGVTARRELDQRRSDFRSLSATEAGFREATSETSTKRLVVASALCAYAEAALKSSSLNDIVSYWSQAIESSLFGMINEPCGNGLEAYQSKKMKFASQINSIQAQGCDDTLSAENRIKLQRIVILIMREPDNDSSNVGLLQALSRCICVHLDFMVVHENLLLHAIADGSCTYFDVLLQCLSVSKISLSPTQCRQTVAAALGNPTKRILLAGTILRREKVFKIDSLQDDLRPLWQDFFWNISSKSLLFEEIEDGMSLREPLLMMLANHTTIHIRFDEIAPHGNPKSFSLLTRLCRDVQDARLLSQLLHRPKQSVQIAIHSRSGNPPLFPLSHAVVAGNILIVEALSAVSKEDEIKEADIALKLAPVNLQSAIRDTLRLHTK